MNSKSRHTEPVKDDLAELRKRLGAEVGISTERRSFGDKYYVWLQFRVQVSKYNWHVLAETRMLTAEDTGGGFYEPRGLLGLLAKAYREVERLEEKSQVQGVLKTLKDEV